MRTEQSLCYRMTIIIGGHVIVRNRKTSTHAGEGSLVLEEDDNVSPYANDISSLCRSRCKELKQRQPIQGFNKQKKKERKKK